MLKILFFGDVSGEPGRKAVKKALPQLLASENPDVVLANVDNLAHGKGITVKTLEELIRAGVMGFTSGNHGFSKKELSEEAFKKHPELVVRPANIPNTYPGQTAAKIATKKGTLLLGHFLGQVFMENQFHDPISSPFAAVDQWLIENQTADMVATVIDFHAEATSEKKAFGYYLDGKVSAVLGTHTHIPTADAKILPEGTAYLTDVGMCGAADSVLGVRKEQSLRRFLSNEYMSFDIPEDAKQAELTYVIIEVDETTKKAINIKANYEIISL
ncbi:MAG: YmdB family metallophosphoesterase [Candidatus Doudnabacteria bacterium]|nr:YmdB family metallophosphoesterase [Candidatus Doudnabacteria bacterium]